MSYHISMSGHTNDEETEKTILDKLRETVMSLNSDYGNVVGMAQATVTQFHGAVDLKEMPKDQDQS